jgi:hypothetical protein
MSKDSKSPEFIKGFELIQKVIRMDRNNMHASMLYARYIAAAHNKGNLNSGKLSFGPGVVPPASKNTIPEQSKTSKTSKNGGK